MTKRATVFHGKLQLISRHVCALDVKTHYVCFQLHHSLQQKRAGQVLNMEEISPRLAGLRSTVIAMPGLQANSTGPVSLLYI